MTQEPPFQEPIEPEAEESTLSGAQPPESLEAEVEEAEAELVDQIIEAVETLPAPEPELPGSEATETGQGAEPDGTQAITTEAPSGPPPGALEQEAFSLQRLWSEVRPALKEQTIRALRATIQVLEAAIARLEAPPPPPTPQEPSDTATASGPTAQVQAVLETVQTYGQRVQTWWETVLARLRQWLPASINQQVSNPVLTGAIAALLVVFVWTGSALLTGKPTQVATAPATQPSPSPSPSPSPEVTIPVPTPKPTTPPAPFKKSAPKLQLTPEQKLIAAIQDQVSTVSKQYAEGLIQSVQANFRSSRLLVNLSQDWYSLPRSQQDKLANDLLRRAQNLDFNKLEIVDPNGLVVARSPVVGPEMVILKRTSPASQTV